MSRRVGAGGSRGWPAAALRALLIVVAVITVFAIVPDRIADFLDEGRASADVRDIILLAWFAFGIVAIPWALVRLQDRGMI